MVDENRIKLTQAEIAERVRSEIADYVKHSQIRAAARDSENGSVERQDYDAFLRDRSERLGLGPAGSASAMTRAQCFIADDAGVIKLALTRQDAQHVLNEMDTGQPALRTPTPTAAWLSTRPSAITNFERVREIAESRGKLKSEDMYVCLKPRDLLTLPRGVAPSTAGGRLDYNHKGEVKVFFSKETAKDALLLMDGKDLFERCSATAYLLKRNPGIIMTGGHNGGARTPRDVVEAIANGSQMGATRVAVDPRKLMDAARYQKKPEALIQVFDMAKKESLNHAFLNRVQLQALQASRETEKRPEAPEWLRKQAADAAMSR